MKLEPLFSVKEHNLYKISDNSKINPEELKFFDVKWSEVEIDEDSYNENFLADLRDQLKILDESNQFAIINAIADKPLSSEEDIERFNNTFNHTARRIKDCISVTGIQLPSELTSLGEDKINDFIELLAKKHEQYVYFSKQQNIQNSIVVIY